MKTLQVSMRNRHLSLANQITLLIFCYKYDLIRRHLTQYAPPFYMTVSGVITVIPNDTINVQFLYGLSRSARIGLYIQNRSDHAV